MGILDILVIPQAELVASEDSGFNMTVGLLIWTTDRNLWTFDNHLVDQQM